MATRTTAPMNVARLDGEGKTHADGGKYIPLCKLRGHGDHTWEPVSDAVDCQRCINLSERRAAHRERLEYATRVAESQEPGSQHLHPMEDAQSETPETDTVDYSDLMEETSVIPAVTPVIAENGETVTVPVDYDDASKGRRELDASKGERLLGEDTYRVSTAVQTAQREAEAIRERERAEYVNAFAAEAPKTAEAVEALIRKLTRLHQGMTGATVTETFSVTYHEPKNGPALEGVEIPALPQGVNENTWELAFTANTESARNWHRARADEQMAEFDRLMDAKENEAHAPF